jgi:hypothetical protein
VLRTVDGGQSWRQEVVPGAVIPDPAAVTLTSVAYEPASDALYFVGRRNLPAPSPDEPVALRLSLASLTWSALPVVPGPQRVHGLESVTAGEERGNPVVYAVGDLGVVLRHRPGVSAGFEGIAAAGGLTRESLEAVTTASAGPTSEVFAVGVRGAFVHFDGAAWRSEKSHTSLDLRGIFFLSVDRGWACGRGEERETDTPATGIVVGYR